jgi:hypothetical protein
VSRFEFPKRRTRTKGSLARARQVHSVFEDAGCDIASHHRCAAMAPVCSCDPATGSETPHECCCGHTHVRPTLSGIRETGLLIETTLPGVL